MSERHRALPSWMTMKAVEVSEREPLKIRRKRKTARAAFYCMNEKELVEAAVSCLTNRDCDDVLRIDQKTVQTFVKMKENRPASKSITAPVTEDVGEESTDCGDAQDMTYVSETDLDITEVETIPYTSPQHHEADGQRSGQLQEHGDLGPEAEKKEECLPMPADAAEEDDALRLVREIFFT